MIIQNDARYRVKLVALAEIGPFRFRPLNEQVMAGSMLAEIVEKYGEGILDHARPE